MRYLVSGRPQVGGRETVTRGGHHWARSGVLVEVLDAEEDPVADPTKEKEGAPRRIGRKTWAALKADAGLISITPEGEAETDSLSMREENARLRARVAELEAERAAPPAAVPSEADTADLPVHVGASKPPPKAHKQR